MQDRKENDVASVMPASKNSLRVNGGMEIGWFFVSSPVELNPVGVVESPLCDLYSTVPYNLAKKGESAIV